MSAEARARRERARLTARSDRAQHRRSHALAQQARTLARLDELDAELDAAAAGLAELDRLGADPPAESDR